MKKMTVFLALVLMVASVSAFAGAVSISPSEKTSIITPDIATGMYRSYRHTYDKDMNILVCPQGMSYKYTEETGERCFNSKGENKWIRMEKYIPNGKKFVGFQSISVGGSHAIEIYWK